MSVLRAYSYGSDVLWRPHGRFVNVFNPYLPILN